MPDNRNRIIPIASTVIILCVIITLIANLGRNSGGKTVTAGFIMNGDSDGSGWDTLHYEGLEKACRNLHVKLTVKQNVPWDSNDCLDAVRQLAKGGANLIVLSSMGYSNKLEKSLDRYKKITFYTVDSMLKAPNSRFYFLRIYQARYLAGIIAGLTTRTDRIGYIASMRSNEVNRGINAFTLGVRSVNPLASVCVSWTGDWNNRSTEQTAAHQLISRRNVDLLTYHQDDRFIADVAEEAGIWCIGYHIPLEKASPKYLTCISYDWSIVFDELLKKYIKETDSDKTVIWPGLEQGAVYLTRYSSDVSERARDAVLDAKMRILQGQDVFSGLIYDNHGVKRCDGQESISDAELLNQMNWFVEGVVFYDN